MASGGDSRKVVTAALAGNGLIAVAKFIAAFLSGSVAMLAEAVHSVADTANQALLLLGLSLAGRRDPIRYPFGRSKEIYFWSFVVSLMLFLLGGLYAIYEGAHKLMAAKHDAGAYVAPVVVLGVSICLEGASFFVAFREFNRTRAKRGLREALFHGRDPTIPIVLLEDTGALVGLAVALVAVVASWVLGSSVADAVGSLLIGVLLCGIGLTLAYETHSLIIGEGATPEMERQAYEIASNTSGVERVTQLLTMHLGPDTIILALKVHFRRDLSVSDLERVTNDIEARIVAEMPAMKKIFIEADSHYDPALDHAMQPPSEKRP